MKKARGPNMSYNLSLFLIIVCTIQVLRGINLKDYILISIYGLGLVLSFINANVQARRNRQSKLEDKKD